MMPVTGDVEDRVRGSFGRQRFMALLGAELTGIGQGTVEITCPFSESLTQQAGLFHAGVLASLADSACGYAALTTMPEGSEVVSVEFKINLLRPCKAPAIKATGRVIKSGRTLVVCDGEVSDETGDILFAKMTATMFTVK